MRWSYTRIPAMLVVYRTCYLSIDNYNANEFLTIEMDGIERTITKNGCEPILVSFDCHNNGSGRNIKYRKNRKTRNAPRIKFSHNHCLRRIT